MARFKTKVSVRLAMSKCPKCGTGFRDMNSPYCRKCDINFPEFAKRKEPKEPTVKDYKEDFSLGGCKSLALVLNEKFGFPLYVASAFWKDDLGPGREDAHVVVEVSPDVYWDGSGLASGQEILDACVFMEPEGKYETKLWKASRKVVEEQVLDDAPVSDEEVEYAEGALRKYLGKSIDPEGSWKLKVAEIPGSPDENKINAWLAGRELWTIPLQEIREACNQGQFEGGNGPLSRSEYWGVPGERNGLYWWWSAAVADALHEGKLTVQEAVELGWEGSRIKGDSGMSEKEWKGVREITESPLYHVTAFKSAIESGGLKTRYQLRQSRGPGLGGGSADTISFTTDLNTARGVYEGILLKAKVTQGLITNKDLEEMAKRGVGAPEPFYELSKTIDWGRGTHTPMGYLEKWLRARQEVGGLPDPLFMSDDPEGLKKIPIDDIAILEFRPKKGAVGVVMSGMSEVRGFRGSDFELVGEVKVQDDV